MYMLEHPEHGRMPVYDLLEVERNRKFGWAPVEEKPTPEQKPEPEKRKPGRPKK